MKKVTTVVLHYRHPEDTKECIRSIQKSSYEKVEIILVNNSEDNLDELISKNLELIETGQNLGYTGGNNVGIKKALENNSDFIFILNPDTTVDVSTIKNLVEAATQEGIYGPKIHFKNGKEIWYAGGVLDTKNVLGTHRGMDEKDNGQYDKEVETDFVTGAAFFATKEVFKKVGFFDDSYFLYMEDVDFCFRAKQAGYKIMYIPEAVVYHKNARSTGLGSQIQDYYLTRNRLLFASKFLSFRTRFALFREALRNLGNPVRRRALLDFLMANFGKGDIN
jgi:GT2 family glycosyltransferase